VVVRRVHRGLDRSPLRCVAADRGATGVTREIGIHRRSEPGKQEDGSMLQSFVIMLREGVEAALVIGIILVALERTGRKDLKRPVWLGLGLAVLASVGAAVALSLLPIQEEVYEGVLYWVSAAFVISMLWWVHRNARTLKSTIEQKVADAASVTTPGGNRREAWGLGAFAFLMLFREGAEVVMFLGAVNLTTDAMLAFIGTVLGLAASVAFGVMFVKGSLRVDLRRFFAVTEWVLAIFIVQLVVNGYHEFSESGVLPATQRSMALIGPIVRNNTLFVIALVAIPLFVWLTGKPDAARPAPERSLADERLAMARAKRERFYRHGAVVSSLLVLVPVAVAYAVESMPKEVPAPEPVAREGDDLVVPLLALDAGTLKRFGVVIDGRTVRFLAMKTADGRYRTAVDACEMCGAFGYVQDEKSGNLVCLNCAAEINPLTMGHKGGCNPIPLGSRHDGSTLRVAVRDLEKDARRFSASKQELVAVDPVCGMRVPLAEAGAFETYEGKTYYFCNMPGGRCHGMFKTDPAKFAK
jgi:high-affinity iron transporter